MNTSLQHQRRRRRLEPDTVRNQKDAARLLAGTLARVKKPARLSLSIRLQLLGLVKHWFAMRVRGETRIYPGTERMMEWGACSERTARTNVATLKGWGVLRPIAHEEGGAGKATEFFLNIDALWQILVVMKARPSDALRDALKACNEPHKKGAVFGQQINSDQCVACDIGRQSSAEDQEPEKAAEKGAAVAPRSYYDDKGSPGPAIAVAAGRKAIPDFPSAAPAFDVACYEDGEVATELPETQPERMPSLREPAALRSADAALVCLEEESFRRAACGEAPALSVGATSDAEVDLSPDERNYLALLNAGPITYGAAATRLGWGATRASCAEAKLLRSGLATFDQLGRTVLAVPEVEPAPPLCGGRAVRHG